MSKVAYYLQEHLTGEVMASVDARRFFSNDASILTITPSIIVYPKNENDVRKTARFTWQLAERGRVIPITARGAGTSKNGAALGTGIILAFPAHMNHILELDSKTGVVIVEPGTNYGKLQQTLQTHNRFLPPYPASLEYSTIGGAVADNMSGEKSVKYGDTRDYVRYLRIVLANGEVIETQRLSKRELSKKLGLSTFEGEIYRAIDTLIEEQQEHITKSVSAVTKNSAGYFLEDVKRKDGSFDLTPLFVGSQGTLGIVTEIGLDTEPYDGSSALVVAHFDDIAKAQKAILALRNMSDMPSAIEMVDEQFLTVVDKINPSQLKDVISKPYPKIVLFIEFDYPGDRQQKKLLKRAQKILDKLGATHQVATDANEQEKLWKIRHAASTIMSFGEGSQRALPIVDDGIVPPERFQEFLEGIYKIFAQTHLQPAVWGHAGDAHLHVQPFLDLNTVGDRQRVFRIMEDYYDLVISLGGSVAGAYGEGRLAAPYIKKQYSPEMYELFQKVKKVFDPYGTLNPGVKVDVTIDAVKAVMRQSYSLGHLYNHMPRS